MDKKVEDLQCFCLIFFASVPIIFVAEPFILSLFSGFEFFSA